ncbi:MAG: hypothetical protein LBE91_08180 [Tannerella sp.]|jgi:hypothetical protein|nr:hypothetical protein [Tannerella sp.]
MERNRKKLAINDLLLNHFIGNADGRVSLQKPNLKNGIVYATDAHSLIAIPESELMFKYGTNEQYPNVENRFGEEGLTPTTVSTDELAQGLAKARVCTEIYMETCKECKGEGTVKWEYYSDLKNKTFYEDLTCPVCEGEEKMIKNHPFPKVSISDYGEKGDYLTLTVRNCNFAPYQLYRVLLVAMAHNKKNMKFLTGDHDQGAIVLIDNIKILVMPTAKTDLKK